MHRSYRWQVALQQSLLPVQIGEIKLAQLKIIYHRKVVHIKVIGLLLRGPAARLLQRESAAFYFTFKD
jgi:hypothetical protein